MFRRDFFKVGPNERLSLEHVQDLIARRVVTIPHFSPRQRTGTTIVVFVGWTVAETSAFRRDFSKWPIVIVVGNDGARVPGMRERLVVMQAFEPHRIVAYLRRVPHAIIPERLH